MSVKSRTYIFRAEKGGKEAKFSFLQRFNFEYLTKGGVCGFLGLSNMHIRKVTSVPGQKKGNLPLNLEFCFTFAAKMQREDAKAMTSVLEKSFFANFQVLWFLLLECVEVGFFPSVLPAQLARREKDLRKN